MDGIWAPDKTDSAETFPLVSAWCYCSLLIEGKHPTLNRQTIVSDNSSSAVPRAIVAAMAFASGFCIMTVEMLGARILSPYFGGSLSVWGSIITIFMLALALGYLWGGKLSARKPNAITFAGFFIGAAVFFIPIIVFSDAIMEPIFMALEDPRYGSLFAAIFLFFIPTSILGMISPYAVRLMVQNEAHSGQMAGLLYFISTLGSAAGTLGTSFYLVLWFEVNQILWGAIFTLLLAGLVVLAAHYYGEDKVRAHTEAANRA